MDLQWLGLGKEAANTLLQQLLATIHESNVKLYGTAAIPAEPSCKLLLQCQVDLLACNYDQVKPALAAAGDSTLPSQQQLQSAMNCLSH